MERTLPGFAVSLLVREDQWFVSEWSFPFFHPFAKEADPPSSDEYGRTKTMSCMDWAGVPSCAVTTGSQGLSSRGDLKTKVGNP